MIYIITKSLKIRSWAGIEIVSVYGGRKDADDFCSQMNDSSKHYIYSVTTKKVK